MRIEILNEVLEILEHSEEARDKILKILNTSYNQKHDARIDEIRKVMIMIQDFSVKPAEYLDLLHARIKHLENKKVK